jgi:hypothetical protein
MEKLVKDKHSSLLQKSVNYGQKKFNNIDTWSSVETDESGNRMGKFIFGAARAA